VLRDSNGTLISTLTTGMIYNFSTTGTFYIMALKRSMTDIQKLAIIVLDKQQLKNNFIYTAPIATNSTVGFVRPGTHLSVDGSGILSVVPFYSDTNVRSVLSTSVGTGLSWNSGTNRMNVVFPPSPSAYGDTEVRTLLSTSVGTGGISCNPGTLKFDISVNGGGGSSQ
jgi:hypothetical protein